MRGIHTPFPPSAEPTEVPRPYAPLPLPMFTTYRLLDKPGTPQSLHDLEPILLTRPKYDSHAQQSRRA